MHDYAFVGNDEVSAEFLQTVIGKSKPVFVITGDDRRGTRGNALVPSPVCAVAESAGVPVFKTDNPNESEFIEKISKIKTEYFLVFSFGYYLKKEFLSVPKRMCVNIHPSMLPKLRGAAPVSRSIMNGDKETGVSFFKMTSKMDAGPVIMQSKIEITENMSSDELFKKSIEIAGQMFFEYDWENESGFFVQNDADATSAPKIEKRELNYSLSWDAETANRMINGLSGYGVRALFREKRIKIFKSAYIESKSRKIAGTLSVEQNGLRLYCSSGSIMLISIQAEGKKKVKSEEFANGMRIKTGEIICAEYSE